MAVVSDKFQLKIDIANKYIDSALQLALKNPLDNAFIIAQLTQLKRDCSIVTKLSDQNVTAIAGFYMDLPHNSIDFLANTIKDTQQLIGKLIKIHPQLTRQPIFGLYNQKAAKIIESCYRVIQKTPEIKMVYAADDILELPFDSSKYRFERLTTQDLMQVSHLYCLISSMAWTPRLLTFGPYYGAYYGDNLVSIAGVQFTTKWVAEIGNVVTHFKHRRQNLAYYCTKLVVEKLKESCDKIFLCVFADNTPAIRLYEKMGFVKTDDLLLVQYYIG